MASHEGYSSELRDRAVRKYQQAHPKRTYGDLADEFGVHRDTVRRWIRLAEHATTRNAAPTGHASTRRAERTAVPSASPSVPPPRVLARSLAPLPEESLSGFLLRAAYRLERTPRRLAQLSGLMAQGRTPAQHLLSLSPPVLENFSTTMRLTMTEATDMTLVGLQHRLPALADLRRATAQGNGRAGASTWAMLYPSRYCPECLHGDGSPIQELFGGAWQLRWHLPIVFACLTHRRLLESVCPACRTVPNGRTTQHTSLICKPGIAGLHPARCRNPAPGQPTGGGIRRLPCGARLDEAVVGIDHHLPAQDLELLFALQGRLEQQLAMSPAISMGDEERDGAYLPDLVAAAQLILLSWPVGASLAGAPALTSLIDTYAAPLVGGRYLGFQARLPLVDGAQCGALLLAAEALLGTRDLASLHERIRPLARETQKRAPDFARRLGQQGRISLRLTRATSQRLHGFQWDPRVRAQSRTDGFRLEHVPPYLPLTWFNSHFANLLEQLPDLSYKLLRHFRRAASLRLAEMACGDIWPRCAVTLGKPESTGRHTLNVLGGWLKQANLWPHFEDAVRDVADRLARLPIRPDYAHRRSALSDWRLSKSDWRTLCSGIPRLEKMGATYNPDAGTILVWSHVNEAEYLHHPLLNESPQVHSGTKATLSNFVGRFYYRPEHQQGARLTLRRRLDRYGERLASACDRGEDLRIRHVEVIAQGLPA
ncbi:TniQ family protein [Streptomyces sp. B21-083]|uniref:TniQ family protein n=1 Tax=Streptomyces sp. B21-083 TaxID=3039410 RepID=UPI002FEEF2A5